VQFKEIVLLNFVAVVTFALNQYYILLGELFKFLRFYEVVWQSFVGHYQRVFSDSIMQRLQNSCSQDSSLTDLTSSWLFSCLNILERRWCCQWSQTEIKALGCVVCQSSTNLALYNLGYFSVAEGAKIEVAQFLVVNLVVWVFLASLEFGGVKFERRSFGRIFSPDRFKSWDRLLLLAR
jgi:hypothetical protein